MLRIPFQSHEDVDGILADMKLEPCKYLELRMLTHDLSTFTTMDQPSLVMRALLVSLVRRNPRPPQLLGMQMDFQDLRHNGRLSV